jgi:hypothetical protein
VAETVAVPKAEEETDEELDARSINAHTAKWTIIPPKHAERDTALNGISPSPGMMSGHVTTDVSQDTSRPTVSTSIVPGINATSSKKAQHSHRLLQQEITI